MPAYVTKRECQAVAEFASQVMSALNMPGWQILVMEEPADEDDFDDAKPLMREHEHDMLMTRYWRETELMVDHLARWLSRTHSLEQAWGTAHGR